MQSFEYRQGAFQALLNMKNWISNHSCSLKSDRINAINMGDILGVFLSDLDRFMENGDNYELYAKKIPKKGWVFAANKSDLPDD